MTGEFKHGTIIPLIGGEAIASERVFGEKPVWIASYTPFKPNDAHLLAYWDHEIPYHLVDEDDHPREDVDVISTVCPCAGLSQVHNSYGADNPNNKWMLETSEYVLEKLRPRVFWGENAPAFATNIGKPIRDKMYATARKNGYSMTVYRTKNLLHGLSQVRNRSFYFFWRDNQTPILERFYRPHEKIADTIDSVRGVNSFQFPVNTMKPSEVSYYQMIFDWGLFRDKQHLMDSLEKSRTALGVIRDNGKTLEDVCDWLRADGRWPRVLAANERRLEKVKEKKGYMDRELLFPKEYTGAFVLYMPYQTIHPTEDRFITIRESMAIMGLPNDFMLLEDGKGGYPINHVCQNVHTLTAADMAGQVKKYLGGELPYLTGSTLTYQSNLNGAQESWDGDRGSLPI